MVEKRIGGSIEIVQRLFDWYNDLVKRSGSVTRDDVKRFFTDDAVMLTNDTVKCRGVEAHFKHFEELARKMKAIEIQPFAIVVQEADRAAAYYRINFKDVEGKSGTVLDMAFWEFRDGKIAKMEELCDFVGTQVKLESY
jgi:ketosteroid isomerase-like protein